MERERKFCLPGRLVVDLDKS